MYKTGFINKFFLLYFLNMYVCHIDDCMIENPIKKTRKKTTKIYLNTLVLLITHTNFYKKDL